MNKQPVFHFTKAGYQELQTKQAKLQEDRIAAVLELKRGRDMGDLSENGLYKAARQKLSTIDHELRHLKMMLQYGKIILPSNIGVVTIGNTVVLDHNGQQMTYTIVGEYEANPQEKKISSVSPLGKKLLLRSIGDEIFLETPKGKMKYTILEIR